MNEKLQTTFDKISQRLDMEDSAREEILKLNRTIIRNCSLAIRSLHKKNLEKAKKYIETAEADLRTVKMRASDFDRLSTGMTLTAFQEYGEACLLLAFLQKLDFPDPEELDIPPLAYLLALADTVGELRRYMLDCVRREESLDEPERAIGMMDEIFYGLISLEYPDGLIPGVRRKTDVVRSLIERSRGDLSLVYNRHSIKRTLEDYQKKFENQ